jgi:hypothetical protein
MLNTFWKVQFCVQNSTVLKNITEGKVRANHNAVSLFQMTKVEEKPALMVQISRGITLLFL